MGATPGVYEVVFTSRSALNGSAKDDHVMIRLERKPKGDSF